MTTTILCISVAVIGILLMVLCIVFMCVWIHRDAKSRGQSGLVWILIAVLSSPILGLLAYLLAGRKETRVPCQSCGWMISGSARFCENCGTEQTPMPAKPEEKKRGTAKFMIASIVCVVSGILCTLGMVFCIVWLDANDILDETGAFGSSYHSPMVSVMSTNTMFNGEWKVNCYYCSDGYLKRNFTLDDPRQVLYTNTTCEEGEIILHVQQGDVKTQINITEVQGEFSLPLDKFQPGRIRVMIEVRDIKKLKSTIRLE